MAGEYLENISMNRTFELREKEFEKEYRFFNDLDERDITDQLQEYEKYFDSSVLEEMI